MHSRCTKRLSLIHILVFVVAILASLLLPKDQKVEGPLIVEEGNDSVDIATDALES